MRQGVCEPEGEHRICQRSGDAKLVMDAIVVNEGNELREQDLESCADTVSLL